MKNFFRKLTLLLIVSVIAGCGTALRNAPVVDRNPNAGAESAPPVKNADAGAVVVDNRPSYVVKKGDTLNRIAQEQGISRNDLIAWNDLKNPNDIKVDQVLKLAPPNLAGGAQTTSVNPNSGVEIKSITTINPATNKSSPKGDKKPYSEANLAELQKADSGLSNADDGVKPTTPAAPAGNVATALPAVTPAAAPEQVKIEWMWPAEGKVVATFDETKNKGIDIAGKLGQSVFAAAAGKVIYEGSGIRGYGNLVIIKHLNSPYLSAYAHNKVNLVKEGDAIKKGQKIAEMGNSDTDSVKLHFEIRQQGKSVESVDPVKLLPSR
ncbi:MAG: peptidoglycan DD-metalloendopeptidase family protein [Burkholderiaceae bacterium]|nr:peptidoglycan DD-metalloendopeptidase family protein [Burkholderiaceae bacterium]